MLWLQQGLCIERAGAVGEAKCLEYFCASVIPNSANDIHQIACASAIFARSLLLSVGCGCTSFEIIMRIVCDFQPLLQGPSCTAMKQIIRRFEQRNRFLLFNLKRDPCQGCSCWYSIPPIGACTFFAPCALVKTSKSHIFNTWCAGGESSFSACFTS